MKLHCWLRLLSLSTARRWLTQPCGGCRCSAAPVAAGMLFAIALVAAPPPARPLEAALADLVAALDAGDRAPDAYAEAANYGLAAAVAAARFLDPARPARSDTLYRLIAAVGLTRKSPRVLLQMYDPAGCELFYAADAAVRQAPLAAALDWARWPPALTAAVIRAAPLPGLSWLRGIAAQSQPDFSRALALLEPWAWWIGTGNEQQYRAAVADCVGQLSRHAALQNPTHITAVLRIIGQLRLLEFESFAVDALGHSVAEVRAMAALTAGRLGSDACRAAVVQAMGREDNSIAQQGLADAVANWPAIEDLGPAAIDFCERSSPAARVSILAAAAAGNWSQREQLAKSALASGDAELQLAGLCAAPPTSDPELIGSCLDLANQLERPDGRVAEALGRLGQPLVVNVLRRWFDGSESPLLQVQLVLALERVSGTAAETLLQQWLAQEHPEPLLTALIDVAGRRPLPEAPARLAALVVEPDRSGNLRRAALWALAADDSDLARHTLAEVLAACGRRDERFAADLSELDAWRAIAAISALRMRAPRARDLISRTYPEVSPAAQLRMLFALSLLQVDDPIIDAAFASPDFIVLLTAVRAARASGNAAYEDRLARLAALPMLHQMLASNINTQDLEALLHGR